MRLPEGNGHDAAAINECLSSLSARHEQPRRPNVSTFGQQGGGVEGAILWELALRGLFRTCYLSTDYRCVLGGTRVTPARWQGSQMARQRVEDCVARRARVWS